MGAREGFAVKIYLASSWRNETYPAVLGALRGEGWEVYDFREGGFEWAEVGMDHVNVDYNSLASIMNHPQVERQFDRDMDALDEADVIVCLLPCGRSAHMELGYAVGCGDKVTVLVWVPSEPEVMHRMCQFIVADVEGLLGVLHDLEPWFETDDKYDIAD